MFVLTELERLIFAHNQLIDMYKVDEEEYKMASKMEFYAWMLENGSPPPDESTK